MTLRRNLFLIFAGCVLFYLAGCSTVTSQKSASNESSKDHSRLGNAHWHVDPDALAGKSALPIPDHDSIEAWVREFSGRKHKSFQTLLDRSVPYAVPTKDIFADRGLPKDLIYVALVESGFTPKARSKAKAVGMWQFIPDTGRRFGLEQNQWIDERCHPMKAARAAADYLSFLYDTFGSWPLALAAYNCGEGAVQSALDRTGYRTFWELRDNGYLPSETRDYVPKVLATVKIARDAKRYGFYLGPGRPAPRNEIVSVPGGVKLSWVGKQIGLSQEQLEDCNPELCKPVTPPGCSTYNLCVPEGTGESVLAALVEQAQDRATFERTALASFSDTSSVKNGKRDTSSQKAAKGKGSSRETIAVTRSGTSRGTASGAASKGAGGSSATASAARAKDVKEKSSGAQVASNKTTSPKQTDKAAQTSQTTKRQADALASVSGKDHATRKMASAQNAPPPSQKSLSKSRLVMAANDQDSRSATNKSTKKKAKP